MSSLVTNRIGRRQFIGKMAKMAGAFALYDNVLRPFVQSPLEPMALGQDRPLRFGTTFSQLKTWYLGLDHKDALKEFLSLDLDFIRLGSYWSEIEHKKGDISDFRTLDWQLNQLEKHGRTEVILTVGIKAPVYPEFQFPAWVQDELKVRKLGIVSDDPRLEEYGLRFVRALMERYGDAGVVKCIQVENEPFDPVLYDFKTYRLLGMNFVRKEIELVRAMDPRKRPILLNMFVETSPLTAVFANIQGNPLFRLIAGSPFGRYDPNEVIKMADIVGYDVYPSVGWEMFGKKLYIRPWRDADYNNLVTLREKAEIAGKAALITEAQAEPWEPGSAVHIKQREYPSFNPMDMERFIGRLVSLGFRDIALWGIDHWLWHRRAGHPEWWEKGIGVLSRYRSSKS